MYSHLGKRRDILVGIANGELRLLKFAIKIKLEQNPLNMHEVYAD